MVSEKFRKENQKVSLEKQWKSNFRKDLFKRWKKTKRVSQIANQTKNTIKLLPFIVIYEQEALILADIQAFNTIYKTAHTFTGNPLFKSEPKELLKQWTRKSKRKYEESDTPEIFQQLNFQKVYKNHKGENSFQSFIIALEKAII